MCALNFDPDYRVIWKPLRRPPEILAFYLKNHRSKNYVLIPVSFLPSGFILVDHSERLLTNPGTCCVLYEVSVAGRRNVFFSASVFININFVNIYAVVVYLVGGILFPFSCQIPLVVFGI